MQQKAIGHNILWLPTVNSTNAYSALHAKQIPSHGVVVATPNQTEGRGQGGNTWESHEGMNLTFSIILHPTFLCPSKQFLLSKTISLGITDALKLIVNKPISIKWPNDIYINNSKVAGILIENSICGTTLETSIVGVGLNVNQTHFPSDIPNPTSLALETGHEHKLDEVLNSLCTSIEARYAQLQTDKSNTLATDYHEMLYRRESFYPYSCKGKRFRARIFGVKDSGELILETETGEIIDFLFKEVMFEIQ